MERRKYFHVAAESPRQQACLNVGDQAPRYLLSQQWMDDGGCLVFLVAAYHQLPRLVCQLDCATFGLSKIAGPNLLIVHQRQHQSVRYQGTQMFHKVER